jgi:hypothetical protein
LAYLHPRQGNLLQRNNFSAVYKTSLSLHKIGWRSAEKKFSRFFKHASSTVARKTSIGLHKSSFLYSVYLKTKCEFVFCFHNMCILQYLKSSKPACPYGPVHPGPETITLVGPVLPSDFRPNLFCWKKWPKVLNLN